MRGWAARVLCAMLVIPALAYANGRQPCDRGAGGIAYCVGHRFICNDGRVSGSKKVCDASTYGNGEGKKKKK